MKGCKPLNRIQVRTVLSKCKNILDKALLTLGFCTGFRISELLSVKIKDIANKQGIIIEEVSVKACNTKTKQGRTVNLNNMARKALKELVDMLNSKGITQDNKLFVSRNHDNQGKIKSITRQRAWQLIKELFELCEIYGKVATHTLRKTFAQEMYILLKGKLEKIQIALGHKSITSTIAYLSFNQVDIDNAVMEVMF